jgi:hypothetical protein
MVKHLEKQEAKARQVHKRRRMAAVDSTMLTSGHKAPVGNN